MTPAQYAALVEPLRSDAASVFVQQAEKDQEEFSAFVAALSVEQFATLQGNLRNWISILGEDGVVGGDSVAFPLDTDESLTHHVAWLVTAE